MKPARFALIFLILCLPSVALAVTRHYVHPGLTGGNNNGSSWANAWRAFANVNWSTLQTEAATQPVYLYVKKGSTSTSALIIVASGSSHTNRIYITTDPSDSGDDPIVTGIVSGAAVKFDSKSYLTISHIVAQYNHQGGFSGYSTSNIGSGIILEDCRSIGNGTDDNAQGIFFKGHDIIIRRCEVGDTGGVQHGWCHGIYIDQGTTIANIYDNLIYGSLQGSGVQTKANANIYRNRVYSNRTAGIGAGENGVNNITVNVYNNLVYNNNDQAFCFFHKNAGNMTVNLYNNSTYLNGTGGAGSWFGEVYLGSTLTALTMENNIFYAGSGDYTVTAEANQTNMTADYNIHYGPSGNPIYHNGAGRTWSYWTNTLGLDAHGGNLDPRYTNGSSDMTLQSTSPAINAGVDLGATYLYGLNPWSSWPSSVTTLNQNSYGSGWEIGAFVYPENSGPRPPSGLRIIE